MILDMIGEQRGDALSVSDITEHTISMHLPVYAQVETPISEWRSLCVEALLRLIRHGMREWTTSMHYIRQYVTIVSSEPLWGVSYFLVKVQIPSKYRGRRHLYLGLCWSNIIITQLDYKVIKSLKLRKLKSLSRDGARPNAVLTLRMTSGERVVIESLNNQAETIHELIYDLRRLKSQQTATKRIEAPGKSTRDDDGDGKGEKERGEEEID